MQIILAEIRKGLRVFFANYLRHAFVFLLFPLVLGVLYGALYESFTSTKVNLKPLTVYVSAEGQELPQAITRDLSYVKLIHAPADIRAIVHEDPTSIGLIVELNQVTIVDQHKPSLEKNAFINYIEQQVHVLAANQQGVALTSHTFTTELEPQPKMTSREDMLTSSFTGISLFLAFTLTGIFLKSREKHVVRRLMSLSLNKWQLYVGNTVSAFIVCFIFALAYFLVSYRLILNLALGFSAIVLVAALHSIFLAAVHGLLIGVFHAERSMRNITTPFIMMFMFLGGTIFPVDNIKGANTLAGLTPNYLLKNIYGNLVLTRTFAITPEVIILSIATVALLAGGAILFSLREEV